MYERIGIADKKPEAMSQNLVSNIRRKTESSKSMESPVDRILFLQRTIGNQAVGKLIESGAFQAKLRIGQPGDVYEQEADRVAEQVMRMPDVSEAKDTRIQRKCPKCLRGLLGEDKKDEKLQAKQTPGQIPEVNTKVEANINALKGGGQPLPESTRAFFEPRFGQDFSQVRVHTDEKAAESAKDVNAEAFTIGQDIAFASGHDASSSEKSNLLLAHELTHVIQQGYARPNPGGEVRLAHAQRTIMPYRSSDSANFGACNSSPSWVEKSFSIKKDKNTKPWIEKITINFDGSKTDSDGDLVPTGNLTATYFANSANLPDINVGIVGGKASQGLTDEKDSHEVTRIEGCGYHHTSVPKAERITGHKRADKYFKDTSKATMNFAVFFVEGKSTGNQAIHQGSLSSGSLACVHISSLDTIRQVNYHSVSDLTKVKVSYSARKDVCCERHKAKGYMVSNPCRGQDPKKCP